MLKLFSVIKGAGVLWPLLAIFATLSTALVGTGWLLKKSYEANGRLTSDMVHWRAANVAWQVRWSKQKEQFEAAQLRLQQREDEYQRIEGERNEYQQKLRAILGGSSADNCGLRPDIWMLIQDSAAGRPAGNVPGD